MDISFAGFDWISVLIIVVAGIMGLVKSTNANKKKPHPVFSMPFEEEEEEEDEGYTSPMEYKITESSDMESVVSDDYYPEKQPANRPESPENAEEEIQAPAFDIRQAIISSEILKRPEF